ATSPMRREAVEAYVEAANQAFGNTQSLHDHGTKAAEYIHSCKGAFGEFLNARGDGFYFTGNASEGNQLAIRSILRGRPKSCNVIITTYLEHASVLITMNELEKEGYIVRYAPVNQDGIVDNEWIENEVNEQTALVVLQLVNSEMGAIQPVKECVALGATYGVPVHCDMVQAFGKLPIDLDSLGVTSGVISPHKFGGPKGIGVVYINPSVHWESVMEGTTHQNGFRAGTVDVPAIVASTIAAKLASSEQKVVYKNAVKLQQYLLSNIHSSIQIVGSGNEKSPFIQGMILPHIEGQWMMLECNRHQIAISTGTACKIGHGEAISAIKALGFEVDAARRFVRVSFSGSTEVEDVEAFLKIVNRSL
ncbi:MAG: IscS subfamily cysteine desulfurase, partial [Melioribacteraceae bacterium]|nr:IscS subfamily cysteine desulfurase [Melioribacteraceae bacterium]